MALGSDGLLTVVGDFDALDNAPVSGKVTFTPSVQIVRGDITYPQLPTTVLLDADGKLSIKLPATDDPAVSPNGFTYKVDIAVTAFVNGRAVTDVDSKNVTLNIEDADAQGVAQLSDLLPTPTVGTPTVFLTRVAADSRYLLKTEIPELPSNLATTDDLAEYVKTVDLEEVDLTPYAKTADVTAAVTPVATTAENALTAAGTAQTTANNALTAAQQGGKPAGLTPFALRLADRANTPINVVAMGSSSVQGSLAQPFTQKWVDLFGQMLHASYNPTGVPGGRHSLAAENVADNPANWAFTGTIQTNPVRGFGLLSKRLSAGATMTGSFDLTTGFTVQYATGSGIGAFTVSIDGAAAVTVTPSTSGSANTHDGSWTTPTVYTRGTHTIKITAVGVTEISGVYAHDGDEQFGVRVWNSGRGGSTAADFLGQTSISQRLATLNPALVLLMYGSNDWSVNTTPAQFKTNVQTHIAQITTAVAGPLTFAVIGMAQRLADPGTVAPWSAYLTALKEIVAADSARCVYVDCASQFPTTNDAANDPLDLIATDNIHPTTRGHAVIADAVAEALKLPNRNSTRVLAAAAATPQPPTALTISGTAGNGQATIGATGGSGATSYALYQGTTPTGTPVATSFPATVSGLTNGTAVSFVATATNAQGTVTSNVISVTPSNTVVLPADDFNRADGDLNGQTTSTGSKTWRVTDSAGATVTDGVVRTVSATAGAPNISSTRTAVIDLGAANHTVEVTLSARTAAAASTGGGLFARAGTDGSGYFLSVRVNASTQGYALYRQDGGASPTSTLLVQSTTTLPAVGDRLRMECVGSSIVCKVNGTTVFSVSDAGTYATNTGAGMFFNATSDDTRFDNWAQVA